MEHLSDNKSNKEESDTEDKSKPKNFSKKKYNFHIGYGWLSGDELFQLRQIDPRYAP